MSSENVPGADNQQERPEIEQWIVGFVDGEGCFSCPVQRNKRMSRGWQVQPRFAVVQGARSREVLELLQNYFQCGGIYRNRRHDNHKEDLFCYNVHRWNDLRGVIVPFFDANPLRTAKREDFRRFKQVLTMMDQRLHLSLDGLRQIAEVTQMMNHRRPSRFLESSEAIRQPPLLDAERRRYGPGPVATRGGVPFQNAFWKELPERNSLSGKFRPARMA
jgi:LAGLIDADG endonuclease